MGQAHVVAVAVTGSLPVFELAVACEVFGLDRSDIVDPWYELRLCAAEAGPLRTAAGLGVDTPYDLDDLVAADTVLVPGIHRSTQLDPPEPLLDALRRAYGAGKRIVSFCGGGYVLAAAGLLDGRRATQHWMNALDFAHRFPRVQVDPTVLYVDDGQLLTSAGTAAAIDLSLHIVRQDHGSAVAAEVARRMVVAPPRQGSQAQHPTPLSARLGDPRRPDDLSAVLAWAQERLDQPLAVADLARQAHLSPTTFARRFRTTLGATPLQWLVEQRVRRAQELLETTDEPVERIARLAGFGTPANLRHHFQRLVEVSPQTYRHVFRYRARVHA
ncbi:helix-turn-helix domain-containing protein [Cryptosporangium arvum]|uniref:Transcriptional regulator containing an amidase domain and an AraC-type DNA-binding HTH domain n=1 Tax=Cryptosporangium arvum DSM 44712 TaxID=927661 RepID=A0A010YHM5_9ACTN|nr:helix-turn-helix domain-containing protein [Cryptosporangium arvum]EXG79750.1 transcriptional regulator containing an amidase domain and an AraC-type DNA-binding HTH domain [Cryptosporangium arvum DSM 44712]